MFILKEIIKRIFKLFTNIIDEGVSLMEPRPPLKLNDQKTRRCNISIIMVSLTLTNQQRLNISYVLIKIYYSQRML